MIVLEGADGSGKSTLAKELSKLTGWPVVGSKGPPRSPDEFVARIEALLAQRARTIFDRHPIISEFIYGGLLRPQIKIPRRLMAKFKSSRPFIIYCKSPTGELTPQNNPEIDTFQHVSMLQAYHPQILDRYELYFHVKPPQAYYRWNNRQEVIDLALQYARRFS